jgi:hypothetical protein
MTLVLSVLPMRIARRFEATVRSDDREAAVDCKFADRHEPRGLFPSISTSFCWTDRLRITDKSDVLYTTDVFADHVIALMDAYDFDKVFLSGEVGSASSSVLGGAPPATRRF